MFTVGSILNAYARRTTAHDNSYDEHSKKGKA